MWGKRALLLLVIFLMVLNVSGCITNSQPVKGSKNNEPVEEQQVNNSPSPEQEQEEKQEFGGITDPTILEKLWQDYLYETIATIGNCREFNSPEEIEPIYVARYCWYKYIAEHGAESLELAGEGSTLRLLPLDIVLDYANRYFNLTSLDVSGISQGEYDPQKKAFIFGFGSENPYPKHTENNPFGIHLDKVIKNKDGSLTVFMVNYDPYQNRRVELIRTLTLKEREDGSLYFANGRWDYVNNNLVTLTGEYMRFAKITGFEGIIEELSMIGEIEGKILLAYTPYYKKQNSSLMLVNPDTLAVEKQLKLNKQFEFDDVKFIGDKIVVLLSNKVLTIDTNLKKLEEITLPDKIAEKIDREPNYNEKGNPDVFFGGYDVSNDLTKFVYSDEIGLKLFNTLDKSEILLAETIDIEDSELIDYSYHLNPRFVAQSKKVITIMTGYEGTRGYTLCNLEEGATKAIDIYTDSSAGVIRYDTGLLFVNTHTYNQEIQSGEVKTLYFDFHTEELKEIQLKDTGDTGDIRDHRLCFVGENYAAFITYTWNHKDKANNMFYINRLKLKNLMVESKIISVKAANTYILGALNDGRIIFWYNLNPSEQGVCITK